MRFRRPFPTGRPDLPRPARALRPGLLRAAALAGCLACAGPMRAADEPPPDATVSTAGAQAASTEKAAIGDTSAAAQKFFIREYRVEGARKLPRVEIETAVYSFLGPGRTQDDVESARAALEEAYHQHGWQTVAVQVPLQEVAGGVIRLQVVERTVGRLRVKGAKYSAPSAIKKMAPSLAEGNVINFDDVPHDILALNQLPDRQVTPSLRAGAAPGTVDVDLEVRETAPVHASLELNNRRGPDTMPLRLSGSVSANNLWQAGQGAGLSFQVSPQDTSQVKVFSGYYLLRPPGLDGTTLMLQATRQDSNVSTLGDTAVAGRGTTVGARALFTLPAGKDFTQSASFGVDYKHFDQAVHLPASGSNPATVAVTPITYYPIDAGYTATWTGQRSSTEFNAGVTFHFRGVGSDTAQFGQNRYLADGSFLYFRGDLSHTHRLWAGFEIFGKIQGQIADQALLSGEQASGGGVGTARGYLEAEAVGDNALFGTVELRTPSLFGNAPALKTDWRFFAFVDGGWLKVIDALPDQKNHDDFLSYGVGSRIKFTDHFEGAVIAAQPQWKVGETRARDTRVLFRAAVEY